MSGKNAVVERLRRAVAAGLALGLAGCGPSIEGPIEDGDGGDANADDDDGGNGGASNSGAGTGGGGDGEGGDGPVSTTSADGGDADADDGDADVDDGDADADDGDGDDGVLFDVGTIPPDPTDPINDCFDFPPDEPQCDVVVPAGMHLGFRCIPQVEMFTCDANTVEAALDEANACMQCWGYVEEVPCGPVPSGVDSCCFWYIYAEGQTCPGRPFTVEGAARLPTVVRRSDWLTRLAPRLDHLDDATRDALARAWADEGCFEAASVASFSRFAVQLLALGAPPQLLAQAQQAAAEEVGHARAFFGLASAYGGRDVGPGPLSVGDAFDASDDPLHVAESLTTEGCIAETISAHQLAVAAARAEDPVVRGLLEAIAEEELRHAELAWRALAWMLAQGDDELRARIADRFRRAIEFVPQGTAATDHLDEGLARACGRLPHADRLALAQRALAELVAPAAAAVLEPYTARGAPEHTRGELS